HNNVSPYALLDPDLVTGVSQGTTPKASYLKQNSPNPFGSATRIPYGLAVADVATIRVYDVAGRLVRTLIDDARPAGRHSVVWDGKNDRGRRVPGGVYFCRVQIGSFMQTRKMVVIR
ncbi:MAG: T9SS type A sorting domain-containing protein, partial [Candidatus Latescibacterota bacterium]